PSCQVCNASSILMLYHMTEILGTDITLIEILIPIKLENYT
ncbi:2580_t:CDS:2, partial [Rhizophagus irregularis]